MKGYIINENKTFQTFKRTADAIERRKFPVVNQFIDDEKEFFIEQIAKSLNSKDKIIEMGCGEGRLLRFFKKEGYRAIGFDNDKFFVNYCRKQGLDVFYGDATKKLYLGLKGAFKIAIIDFNTLFNFPKNIRKKWIKSAAYLLNKDGLLLFTAYAKNRYAYKTINERIKFYDFVIKPGNNAEIKFTEAPKTSIEMVRNKRILWFSEWISRGDLVKEIKSWKNFNMISVGLMKNKIAFRAVLKKSDFFK